MLDEFLEFAEYTKDPALLNKKTARLRIGNICAWEEKKTGQYAGKYTGLRRALLVISRHAFYEKHLSIEAIKYLLCCYCGFGGPLKLYSLDTIDEYKYMDGWLIKYLDVFKEPDKKLKPTSSLYKDINEEIANLLETKKIKEKADINYNFKVELLKAELKEKKSDYWQNSIINKNGTINDADTIYFDGIIADAIEEGPLNKYFLTLEKDPTSYYTGVKSGVKDKMLKLVSAYLLARSNEEATCAFVNYGGYSNWVSSGCADSKKVKRVLNDIRYSNMITNTNKDGNIFTADFVVKNGPTKLYPYLSLCEEWIKMYKPQIIPHEDLEKAIKAGLYVYGDQGCSKPLIRKE